MPIRRAGLYGRIGLGAAGQGLQDYAAMRLRRREADRLLQQQHAWEMQKMQMQALGSLGEKIAANPAQGRLMLQTAQGNPLFAGLNKNVLSSMNPPDEVLAAELQKRALTATNPSEMPDIGTEARTMGLDPGTTIDQPMSSQGRQFLDPSMTPDVIETGMNPVLKPVAQAMADRRQQLKYGQEDALELKGREKYSESWNTSQAKIDADNANAWQATENKRLEEEALRAGKVQTAGETAYATAENTGKAQSTKEYIAGAAARAAAEANARMNAEIAKQQKEISMGLMTERKQQAVLQLGDDFRNETAPFRGRDLAYRTLLAAAQPELGKDPKDQSAGAAVAIIFAFMKTMDSAGSVQQGEANRIEGAQNLPDWIVTMYNKYKDSGAPLGQGQIRDFLHQGYLQYQGAKEQHVRAIDRYTHIADTAFHVDPSWIVMQPDPALDVDPTVAGLAPPPPNAGTGGPGTQDGIEYDVNGNPIGKP
jgi:hypothetical protein